MEISKEKLLRVLDLAGLSVCCLDQESQQIFLSEKMQEWLNLDSAMLSKDHFIGLSSKSGQQRLNEIINKEDLDFSDQEHTCFEIKGKTIWLNVLSKKILQGESKDCLMLVFEKVDFEKSIRYAILENSSELIWVVSLESGELVYTNQQEVAHVYGLPLVEGKNSLELWKEKIFPEDRNQFDLKIESLLRGEIDILEHEYRLIQLDGRLLWVRNRANLFKDKNDTSIYIQGKVSNISKEKEKELLNRKIQSIGQIGGWEIDLKTNKMFWTDQTYKIYSLPQGTRLEKDMTIDFFKPHERQKLRNYIEDCATGKSYSDDFEFVDAMGSEKWVQATGEPVYDNNGNVTKLTGTLQEITNLKNKDKNLEIILENISDGYWDSNKDSSSEYVSTHFWRQLGWDFERRQEKGIISWKQIVHKDDLKGLELSFSDHSKYLDKKFRTTRIRLRNYKGEWYWYEHTWAVVSLDNRGEPLRVVGIFTDISEEVEEKQKFEDYHRGLNEYAIIAETDKYGKITWVNDNFCKVSGYKREELIGKNHRIINSGYHPKSYFQNMWRTIKSGNIWRGEIKNKSKRGSYYWVDTIIIPKKNIAGEVISFLAFRYEITDRKLNEFQINNFFNLGINYLAIASPDGYFKSVNPHWLTLGYSKQELLSQPFVNFVHPDDLQKTYEEASKLNNYRYKTVDFINRYRKKNGEYIHMQWKASSDPETGLIYAVCTDITDQVREGEMALAINKLRAIFITQDASKDQILHKFEKVIEKCIESSAHIIHYDHKKNVNYYSDKEKNDKKTSEAYIKIVESLDNYEDPIYLSSPLFEKALKSEKEILQLSRHHIIFPIRYNDRLKGFSIINNEKKVICSENLNLIKELFSVVGELLHNMDISEELDMQKKITMHSSKLASIGEMAADVGHEINNPLAIISGQIETIKKRLSKENILDEKFTHKLLTVEKSIKRIQNIVTGMRGLARSDTLDKGPFKLSSLVNETCEMLEELYSQEGIHLEYNIPDEISYNGHRGRLQQVLVNLLNNAKDAVSECRKKHIQLNMHIGEQIEICISDTGVGMSDEVKDKIFEPFFTTKDVNKGTGIGMALVHNIIKEHSGDIKVFSELGEGTEICIYLPYDRSVSLQEINANVEPPELWEQKMENLNMGVLVVDDEEDIIDVLTDYLSSLSVTVFQATSATQALEVYRKNKSSIQLVISDIKMPDGNGIDLFNGLKSENYNGHFYFMTGGVKIDIDAYLDQAQGLLHKPFTMSELSEIIIKTKKEVYDNKKSA